MIIIPAVDLHQGKCVRLTHGQFSDETVYSTDPVFVARLWQAKGAKRLHLVDLDGAYCGKVQHWETIEKIRQQLTIPIEFGGGVRSIKTVEKLIKLGIEKIILSTVMISDPLEGKKILQKYGDKIMLAVDVREGKVAIGGWKDQTPIDAKEFMKQIEDMGVTEVILTDIDREGMLEGINVDTIMNLIKDVKFKIIISGGVTTLEDIKKIKSLETKGVYGIIIGKALYAEKIVFEEAQKIVEER
ncbi:MAG: 1-(5-phosphoribosyl)-5-[(5-phosphoribosylamino)methylideneamino]imidazole-4-carboxamide isomerase [Endomicrobiia bacterium]